MVGGQPARRDRRHALVPAGLRSRARRRRPARRRHLSRHDAARRHSPRGRRHDRSKGSATADPIRDHGAVRHRRQRAARVPASRAATCGEAPRRWLPPTQGLYTHFEGVERWDRLRPRCRGAAVPDGRCRGAPGVSRRMDLGAALQQRHHQRRRRADRFGGRRDRRSRRRAGLGAAARDAAVGRGSVPARARRRCRSSTRRGWRSAARGWRARRWALLPSAAGVIDPLLSTGFPLTLLGILRLVDLLERTSPGRDRDAALADVRADDAGGAGRDRTAGRRALRDDGRSAAVQAAQPAVLRGGQLQRGGAPARPARAGARLPALRASDVRSGAGGVRGARRSARATEPRDARSKRASTAPSNRSTPPACSIAAAATGIRCSPRISWRRRQSCDATPRRHRPASRAHAA